MKRHAAVLFVWLVSGCGGFGAIRASHQDAIRKRASFDLDCPAAQLELVPLEDAEAPPQYGVKGCGKRAVYVNVSDLRTDTPGTWVLDSGAAERAPAASTQTP